MKTPGLRVFWERLLFNDQKSTINNPYPDLPLIPVSMAIPNLKSAMLRHGIQTSNRFPRGWPAAALLPAFREAALDR